MRLLICGSRTWTNPGPIGDVIDALKPSLVIEGGAPGADRVARAEAYKRGLAIAEYVANWDFYGASVAGLIRNQWMYDFAQPTHGVAFSVMPEPWTNGTANMIKILRTHDVPVLVYDPENGRWLP